MNFINLSKIYYDENGLTKQKFPKDDYHVRGRVDYKNSIIYIVRDDNLLTLFKKKLKTKNKNLLHLRCKVHIMKFCNIRFKKTVRHRLKGKQVGQKSSNK